MESERQRSIHWNGVVAGEFVVITFSRTREGLSMPQGTTLCQGFVLPRKAGWGTGGGVSTSQSVAVPQPLRIRSNAISVSGASWFVHYLPNEVQHVATNGGELTQQSLVQHSGFDLNGPHHPAVLLNCSRLSPIRVLGDGALTAQGG